MPCGFVIGSAVGSYCSAVTGVVVTLTVAWSFEPSGYVIVTGTSTVPGVLPSGNTVPSSIVIVGCGPSAG